MDFKRESIFLSIIRYFFISIAIVSGLSVAVVMVSMTYDFLQEQNFRVSSSYLPSLAEPFIMPDANGDSVLLSKSSPAILRIDLKGVLGTGELTRQKIEGILNDSRESFLKNRVKGILLVIDTPGGSAEDSEGIYHLLLNYRKKHNIPIYAFVDGMCASGGMFIAAAADKIYATYPSMVGSIGVIWNTEFNYSEIMAKIGITSATISEGKFKDPFNPYRAWGPNEDISIRPIMAGLYQRFVSVIAEARPKLTEDLLINEYGARIFLASEAMKLGYIDETDSNYSQALKALVDAAGIEEAYQVVQLFPYFSLLNRFRKALQPQTLTKYLGLPVPVTDELRGKPLYLYVP